MKSLGKTGISRRLRNLVVLAVFATAFLVTSDSGLAAAAECSNPQSYCNDASGVLGYQESTCMLKCDLKADCNPDFDQTACIEKCAVKCAKKYTKLMESKKCSGYPSTPYNCSL